MTLPRQSARPKTKTTQIPADGSDQARFDSAYYRRFYGRGGAHDRRRISHLAAGVHHLASWWGIPIRSVLDVGSGIGFWRDWYRSNFPRVAVTSVDVSEHACARWGHLCRDICHWTPPRAHDLVICHSVLQYLGNSDAESAIENLAAGCKGLLYLEVPTTRDFTTVVDPSGTDMAVHRRSASWYSARLTKRFVKVGAGLWVVPGTVPLYELEAATS